MEKTPRYTQRERNMVLGFAAQYKDVIENKRTDAESNRKKDEVWRQISKEFNARVYHQRSAKQLRQLYKNMKLLLKKDLCSDDKGNRSFMDLLNTLSQQESVAQYISEQMSPGGFSGRPHKFDDDYDDTKFPTLRYDGLDTDVIVIKSEDLSDNDQSQNGGNGDDDMDDDDDDCLSPKDIPEVCLEEDDDEIFATDLRQPTHQAITNQRLNNALQQQHASLNAQKLPEVTIQNVGGIRVGSIGSLANLKALQNGNNSALSITHANNAINGVSGSGSNNNNSNTNIANSNNNTNSSHRQTAAEQEQQHLLLNGLGLSAVNATTPAAATTATTVPAAAASLPTLQRAGTHHNNHSNNANSIANTVNQLLWNYNNNSFGHKSSSGAAASSTAHQLSSGHGSSGVNHNSSSSSNHHHHHSSSRSNDYLTSLAIEERKRKIELLNAQIEYWKTLTKKLDANSGHNPTPSCLCHFPGKVNGLQAPANSS